jgi:glycosyltransferase involved in cell wall biosynthesis
MIPGVSPTPPTKILHVSVSDAIGGAARAAQRIHRALVDAGYDSNMRVLQHRTDDDRVRGGAPPGLTSRAVTKTNRLWRSYAERDWATTNPVMHSFGRASAGLADELNGGGAGVLNLHWVTGMLSVKDIARLEKPIVWTLHDMWAFCGGEHVTDYGPDARFRLGYLPSNRPSGERGPDLNHDTWEAKRRLWMHQRFTVVCPSRWLAECAAGSVLFKDQAIHVIPHPLDTAGVWQPLPREVARAFLRLPAGTKLVLVGAERGIREPHKGGDVLREMIPRAAQLSPDGFELMVYGQSGPEPGDRWPVPVHWLGTIRDDRILVAAYSAADAVVVPSRQESFGLVASEAQACGIPVAAFDATGLPDVVIHGETGWLAKPFDADDLAKGLLWILEDGDRWTALARAARAQAVKRFAAPLIAGRYAEVYAQALETRAGGAAGRR